ncbi:hypothetical protein GGR57DRAFT_78334 [Xylariaceae sp. FL1272]|nr:hypothetical protein GGR57DRAFT_78334 [Xylariaceae sp. FL1272]
MLLISPRGLSLSLLIHAEPSLFAYGRGYLTNNNESTEFRRHNAFVSDSGTSIPLMQVRLFFWLCSGVQAPRSLVVLRFLGLNMGRNCAS